MKKRKFKKFNTYDHNEVAAAKKVVSSGILSNYLGAWGAKFNGGKYVKKFEKKIEKYFKVKHAITVNSWTSGLICAVGALNPKPGDEIITTPWTMSATAMSILHWNCIPVFVDIDEKTFCINPKKIQEKITKKTIAILSVDIGGQSADIQALNSIAKKNDIRVISDSAQAPGSLYKKKFTGTLTDIGGFSLNCHKHIHTGEGGILVTNNKEFSERLRLIRNHGENVNTKKKLRDNPGLIGYNFRLGEIECAIGIEQLKKLKKIIFNRVKIVKKLNQHLSKLKGVIIPTVRKNCTHVYYVYKIRINTDLIGVSRDKIFNELVKLGVPNISNGYGNLHLMRIFKEMKPFNKKFFPWILNGKRAMQRYKINYKSGSCPVSEKLNKNEYIGFEVCSNQLDKKDLDFIILCFKKVWKKLKIE